MISRSQSAGRRKALRRNLQAMNADGFSFSIMVGIAETYLPAFMLARGFGEFHAALIATLPVLLGSMLQLFAPKLLQVFGSHRRFVVTTASLQAVSMVLLSVLALTPGIPAWLVFVPATLYWAGGLSTGPAWNTWVEQLVPSRIRSGFFARRSRLCHVGVLLGLIAGGLLLRASAQSDSTLLVFAGLFGIGAIGRFVSAWMLAKQTETTGLCLSSKRQRVVIPAHAGIQHAALDSRVRGNDGTDERGHDKTGQPSSTSRWHALRTLRRPSPAARLVLFLMAVQTAVHVSGPYFNPFMLKVLNLSWVDYMSLLSLGFIGKMLSLPWAGRVANKLGPERLLWIGALGIMPVSALWFVSQNVWFLASVQIISGLVWGCYELAMLLMFFGRIPTDRRVTVLTLYNVGNSAAMVAGTFIGAAILYNMGRNEAAYLTVFIASSVLRLVALLALPGRRHAIRAARTAAANTIRRRVARPVTSTATRPTLVASLPRPSGSQVVAARASEIGVQGSSIIVLAKDTNDQSSVTRRLLEGGSAGTRRRDSASPATRRPARSEDHAPDLAPRD